MGGFDGVNKYMNDDFYNRVQSFIGAVIIMLFLISLIPFVYKEVLSFLILLIVIQIVVSVFRARILNVFIEVILLFFAFLSAGPILFSKIAFVAFFLGIVGIVFKLIALIVAVFDRLLFSGNTRVYSGGSSHFKIGGSVGGFGGDSGSNGVNKKSKKGFDKSKVRDAEFKEK